MLLAPFPRYQIAIALSIDMLQGTRQMTIILLVYLIIYIKQLMNVSNQFYFWFSTKLYAINITDFVTNSEWS
jgi:hypothetical protein